MILKETTTKRIVMDEDGWEENLEAILDNDHPGTDYLLVQFAISPFDNYYRVYSVADLREGDREPLYAGDELPEAIFACGF